MGMGARWAPRDDDVAVAVTEETVMHAGMDDGSDHEGDRHAPDEGDGPDPDRRRRLLALLPLALALLWLGYTIMALTGLVPTLSLALVATLGVGMAPVAVALLVYLIVTRSGRGESGRFAKVAAAMRAESAALEATLARMAATIVDQNRLLADQAGQLMALGDEAAARLGTVQAGFTRDIATLGAQGARLADATDAARVDLGIILTDVPRIDAQVRDLAAHLQDAGTGARDQLAALDSQIITIAAHAHDADRVAGAAAQDLAAHLSRIDAAGDDVTRRIDAVGTRMAAVAEDAIDHAARMLEDLADGLAAERKALATIVADSHALIGAAGTDAIAAARTQVDLLETRLAGFAQRVAREGAAVHTLADTLATDLAHATDRFETLGADGGVITLRLMEGLEQAASHADVARRTIDMGGDAIDRLVDGSDRLTQAMELIVTALQSADLASSRIAGRIDQGLPTLNSFVDTTGRADDAVDRVTTAIERNHDALAALDAAIARTDGNTQALTRSATPALVNALQLVRDAADEAAEHARAAFSAMGRDAAASLAEAVTDIVDSGVSARVETDLAALSTAAADAADAAAAASERLTRQLATIADTTAAVEARITETREAAEASDEADFSRRVALLIESLNSTAIDVTKILSRDVADDAWAAYLRGDRGVFTRRAVRLLDVADVRTIFGHYNEDRDFHDQVNRYIHDFEAMLRRVLATGGGTLLGVTLLSSDMGKLYVALAQAIERLRA